MGFGQRLAISAAVLAAPLLLLGCGSEEGQPAAAQTTHFSLVGVDVTGLTIGDARKRLEERGWKPVKDDSDDGADGDDGGEYVLVPEDPTWVVCGQSYSTLVDGTRDLFLDAAPSCGEATMPSLVGKTYAEAEAFAESLGLFLNQETAAGLADLGPDWIVCSHEPPAGRFDRGEVDELFVYVEPKGGC